MACAKIATITAGKTEDSHTKEYRLGKYGDLWFCPKSTSKRGIEAQRYRFFKFRAELVAFSPLVRKKFKSNSYIMWKMVASDQAAWQGDVLKAMK